LRDGVPYYITAGGGADLYAAPELGGFHHYLLVRVEDESAKVEVKRVGAPTARLAGPVSISPGPGGVVESWEQGLCSFAWNYTASTELSADRASDGRQSLRLNFDLTQWAWPVLVLPLPSMLNLCDVQAVLIDVFLPPELKGSFALAAGLEAATKHEAPPIQLESGWNTVRAELDGAWLPGAERPAVRSLQWTLSGDQVEQRGAVLFDRLQFERCIAGRAALELLESWERPLLWRVADETVTAETSASFHTHGHAGLKIGFEGEKCSQPVLLARLNPTWDLAGVEAMLVDLYVPEEITGDIAVTLGFRAREVTCHTRPVVLRHGWNQVRFALEENWLPSSTRSASEQIEWGITSSNPHQQGWLVFDNLRIEKAAGQ
jgi:hypothetical protein